MNYGTCDSAGEKSIGLEQDKRKTGGRGGEGQTKEPQSKTGVGQPLPSPPPPQEASHESNPRWLPDWTNFLSHEFIYTQKATPEGENAHTRLNRAFASNYSE